MSDDQPPELKPKTADAKTDAWVAAKAERDYSRTPDDAIKGTRAAIEDAQVRGRDARLLETLSPQLGLEGVSRNQQIPLADVGERKPPGLADKFLVPSFTTLDTRAGYWQKRRREWMTLDIRGETTVERDYSPGHRAAPSGAYMPARGVAKAAYNPGHTMFGGEDSAAPERYGSKGGRKQGLIYQHDAPASDPSFYSKKTAVERELGRELTTEEFKADYYDRDESLAGGASESVATGTSVFDPVLCELAYRWWSPEGGHVVDPFAGGAVRGIVAAVLGRRYSGVELRPEQLHDNRAQAEQLFAPGGRDFVREVVPPVWVEGDATQLRSCGLERADLIFTCPPYADLEVYSDDPHDLSTAPYATFRAQLASVLAQSAELLLDDRFAVFVLGEARGPDGNEYGLVSDAIDSAEACGLKLYNSGILVNSVGSAALRAQMILKTRKLTRVHQHILVFCKGNAKRAAEACGPLPELEL